MKPSSHESTYKTAAKAGHRNRATPSRFRMMALTKPATVVLLCIGLFVAAYLSLWYWVTHPNNRMRGVVLDENRQPIAGARLEVRDAEGKDLGTATTDAKGEVLWEREWNGKGTTFGKYVVTRWMHSTGGRDHMLLAQPVLHKARVKNAITGLVEAGLSIDAYPDSRMMPSQRGPLTRTTDGDGEVTFGNFPATARLEFQTLDSRIMVWSAAPRVVKNFQTTPYETIIWYEVTVVPTGCITGKVDFDGNAVSGGIVYARLLSDTTINPPQQWRAFIHPSGTYRFVGLPPGRYQLSGETADSGPTAPFSSGKFTVQSGQTVTMPLHAELTMPPG